jgi:hypothetical protein
MKRFCGIICSVILFLAILLGSGSYAQPGRIPPGHGGGPPGPGGTPPGHGGTPPGQGGTPPGQGGGKPGNPCPGPPGTPCPQIPINDGAGFLIITGMVIGIKKLYDSNKSKS